jgi:hypothetical protein
MQRRAAHVRELARSGEDYGGVGRIHAERVAVITTNIHALSHLAARDVFQLHLRT